MPPTHISSSVPLTQNTAPILEFRCLFTPDLKKKQKSYKDGRLKFHTFNKRIMVYDDRSNFVGDTHYHTYTLEEGDELQLDRGLLVEVGELIGKQDQDLGEILESVRGAAKSARQASIAPERGVGRGATPAPSAGRYATPAPMARQMSLMSGGPARPLSSLLGTPQGHHGRALLPTTSPFEDRQNALMLAPETPEPASKRRKMDSLPVVQPLWARTSLAHSDSLNENLLPIARELSYPDSIAPKARSKKMFEKPAKPGYAQKLTGAVLDLSSAQKINSQNGPKEALRPASPESGMDEDMVITGSRKRAVEPAPILPPAKRKPAPILPPKRPAEIVYPDSIAPKTKQRKVFEKTSKAGYAEKLVGAALDLSSSNMTKVSQRRQSSVRQVPQDAESDDHDESENTGVQRRPRTETPIHPPVRKPAPILPPAAHKATASREIVYPDSMASQPKPRRTFEKKAKAGYAEKLTGAMLNLSHTPAPSLKQKSQPYSEEEQLLARLAELREERLAAERAEVESPETELAAPKPKKARTKKASAVSPAAAVTMKAADEENLLIENDFVDLDEVDPLPPAQKVMKAKKTTAPRKKKQAGVAEGDKVDSAAAKDFSAQNGRDSISVARRSATAETDIAIRKASQNDMVANASPYESTPQGDPIPVTTESLPSLDSAKTGSLRIKAKPKRKMLMMHSKQVKTATASAPDKMARPAILPGGSLPAQKPAAPEPSQATKTLTDFHDKQREKLQERKKKLEARKKIPIEINSSPVVAPQADDEMDTPSSPINLDEEEWVNPHASKPDEKQDPEMRDDVAEVPVRPTTNNTANHPTATPLSPHTTNRSKSLDIVEPSQNLETESEENALTYTDINNALVARRQGSPLSRSITAPAGHQGPSARDDLSRVPPQPSLPQSSPAFTQQKTRVKHPLPKFPAARKSPPSAHAAKSSILRPPVPLFDDSDKEEPQSSMFVRQDSIESADDDTASNEASNVGPPPLDTEDLSQPIRPPGRVRPAKETRQSSPDWPSDEDSNAELQSPQRHAETRNKARPAVESSDTMSCPESQAEEGGFSSSPPPMGRFREFSAAEEEALANGHSVLVKIKSGIRSKEIIRPKSKHHTRAGDENPFIGFARPPLPIVRSRTASFVEPEAEEGESELSVDDDEVMRELEAQAEEERQTAMRRQEAERKTREFREKRERERVAMEEIRIAEEKKLADEQEKQAEALRLKLEREAQRERALEESRLAEVLKLQAKEKLEREAELKRIEAARLVEAARVETEKKAVEQAKLDEIKLKREKEAEAQSALEQARLAETKRLEAKRQLDERAKYDEMKLRLEREAEAKIQDQVRALQEQLRLANQQLEEREKERVEKEKQQKAETQRLEKIRIKEQNEARQKEAEAKQLDIRRLTEEREKDLAEQLKRAQEAARLDKQRQQNAVEAAAAKLASSASLLPRSLPRTLQGNGAAETAHEKERRLKQTEYQRRVDDVFAGSNAVDAGLEHIDTAAGGSFSEGDLVLAPPRVSAFKMPAARSQTAAVKPAPRTPAAFSANASFNGFPTHLHAAMFANGISTASHDFAPASTPPSLGFKIPTTLHLSAPLFKPFAAPKSVPVVPKKAPKTMKEIRDEQKAERQNREDLKILPGWQEKGEILTWDQGAWTAEAGDLFGWRPKVGDFDDE